MNTNPQMPESINNPQTTCGDEPITLGGRVGIALFLFTVLLIATVGLGRLLGQVFH